MSETKRLKLSSIPENEREVLEFLQKKGTCRYGNIFKELRIPPAKGSDIILSLTHKGYIKHVNETSQYQLNVELI
nr:hypothetical protein [uncultured Carboxylicivirga sp.]